jgi:hypothetical protein
VADALKEAMHGRKLRVPSGGGVAVTLEVTSRWQLPSGYDLDVDVSVAGITLKKASPEAKRPRRVEVLKPELKVVEAPASPETTPVSKLPPAQIQIVKVLGIDFDATDLVPRPLRVVHARVVKEKLL